MRRVALVLALVVALQLPLAVLPAPTALVATAVGRRPQRGPFRDRTLPGKARRHARRNR